MELELPPKLTQNLICIAHLAPSVSILPINESSDALKPEHRYFFQLLKISL